jgi:phage terminase large subunit-like protein
VIDCPRDYVALARAYEADVMSGAVPACRWVRLAVERNVRDLARQGTPGFPYRFDAGRGSSICQFVESLPHVEGAFARVVGVDDEGRPVWNTIRVEPWQAWIYTTVFGWLRTSDGARRFRTSLSFVPRKNGKSTMSAPVALYMLVGDGESGAKVFSAATSRDQARIVFSTARTMAERSPALLELLGVQVLAHQIDVPMTASEFRALASDSNTLEGLNVSCAIIDELHAHANRSVWEVINHATGARWQPLIWGISTAGSDIAGICYEQVEYLRRVLSRVLDDETFFGVEYTCDAEDDWRAELSQRKANPNWGVSVQPDDLERLATKAQHSPAAIADFKAKRLNLWEGDPSSWLSMDDWQACGDTTIDVDSVSDCPCWLGVDLAEVRDIAAVMVLAQLPDGEYATFGRFFLPADTVERSPIAQYRGWAHSGYLTVTDGGATDYQRIEDEILELRERLPNLREIDFDRALAAQMAQRLQDRLGDRPPVVTVDQAVATINPAMSWLEKRLIERSIRHDGNPVLTWMASNVVAVRNHKGELYPRKTGGKNSHRKIDGITALLTAASRAMTGEQAEQSIYETRGVVSV